MADPTPLTLAPILLDDVVATIDGTDYAAAVSTVELVPTAQVVRWPGMTPASNAAFVAPAEWVANLTYAQDWTTPKSLSQVLLAKAGQKVPMTFKPKRAGQPTVSATVVVMPGAIGGAGRAIAQASVSLPVDGQPTVTPTPA